MIKPSEKMMSFAMLYLKFPPILAERKSSSFLVSWLSCIYDKPASTLKDFNRVVPDLITNAGTDGDPKLQVAKGVAQ